MIAALILISIVLIPLSYLWVRSFDRMAKDYPDYKGEGFLENEKNEDRKDYDED